MTTRICDTPGCGAPHRAKGLCSVHYYARYRATEAGKVSQAASNARYRVTPAGRVAGAATTARYRATVKGRADTVERAWLYNGIKRATRAGVVIGNVPANTRAILRGRFGETCLVAGCNNVATDVDHVIALVNGGLHDISNFQTLCGSCNRNKGKSSTDHRPGEWN